MKHIYFNELQHDRPFIFCVLLVYICTCLGCSHTVSLAETERSAKNLPFYQANTTPIIVVARVLHNDKVGSSYLSKLPPYSKVQLYKVAIAVENVLRGDHIPDRLEAYYMADAGPYGGPPRLGMAGNGGTWHIGDRELFFLRPDSGVLRTICDYMRFCVVPVTTGAHPGFKLDLHRPMTDNIVDLLLTRGQGITDQEMAQSIQASRAANFSRDYTLQKLRQLALDNSPDVRNTACQILQIWRRTCPI